MIKQTHVMIYKHPIAENWQDPLPMTPTFLSGYAPCLDSSMLGAHLLKAGFVTANSKLRVESAAGKISRASCKSLHSDCCRFLPHEECRVL